MKKLVVCLSVLVMVMSFVFAGGSSDKSSAIENPKYTIGVFTKDGTTAFWRYCVEGAKQEGESLGVNVREYAPQSYTDSAGQVAMIEDAIQSGVDAICVAACDSTAILPALEKAHDAGIVVVLFNTQVPAFEGAATFVGVDNVEASRAVVAKYLEDVNYDCDMVVIEGDPSGQQNIDRTQCLYEFQDQYENFNLVAIQPGYANREKSMNIMENILQSGIEFDVVWAINDVSGIGAAQAIEAVGLDIPVICIDGTPEGAVACLDGKITYTFDQSPLEQGAFAVRYAVAALDGETLEEFYPTGGTIVSKDNAEEFLNTYYPDYRY